MALLVLTSVASAFMCEAFRGYKDIPSQVVASDLKSKGITQYSWYPANGCIGVTYGNVSCYYYVRDGRIVDIIFD